MLSFEAIDVTHATLFISTELFPVVLLNPEPASVTSVPPLVDPEVGVIEVIVRGTKRSDLLQAELVLFVQSAVGRLFP